MNQMNPLPSSLYMILIGSVLVLSFMFTLNILQVLYQLSLALFLFCMIFYGKPLVHLSSPIHLEFYFIHIIEHGLSLCPTDRVPFLLFVL